MGIWLGTVRAGLRTV